MCVCEGLFVSNWGPNTFLSYSRSASHFPRHQIAEWAVTMWEWLVLESSVCLADPETVSMARPSLSLTFLFQDVPLISLANIFHNAKLWNDAIIVATMAVEIAPHFVVNHFTLANVYVAMVSVLTPVMSSLSYRVCIKVLFSEGAVFKELG